MNSVEHVGGARMAITDAIIALLLLEEGRDRILARVFGVSRDQSFLVTLIAIGVAAQALRGKTEAIRSSGPSVADAAIGAAVLKEGAYRIAGDWSRDTQSFGSLVAFALVARHHPVFRGVRSSLRGAKASSRRARTFLRRRYGA